MASTWRQASEAMFGGDRLSDLHRALEKEGKPNQDYYIHRATLERHKIPGKKVAEKPKRFTLPGEDTESLGTPLDPNNLPIAPFEECTDETGCHPKCRVCYPQFFPATCAISDDEAMEMTTKLTQAITDDRAYLQSMLERHADAMVQRWHKMSQQKRHDLLASLRDKKPTGVCLFPEFPALPHLFNANSKPASEHFYKEFARETHSKHNEWSEDKVDWFARYMMSTLDTVINLSSWYLDSWLLPYIDIKSLSESALPLLSLLHCRTKYPPHMWAQFDKMNTIASEHAQAIASGYNPHCISFHPDDYGSLRKWNGSLLHCGIIIGFNQGLFVLTAQGRMMNFLRKFVETLLDEIHDRSQASREAHGAHGQATDHKAPSGGGVVSNDPRSQKKWTQLIENGFSSFGLEPVVSWSSYTHQHLIAPPFADPVELHKKIQAAYQNAFDDLFLVQTEPQGVQSQVKDFCSSLYFHFMDKKKEWDLICDQVILLPLRRELWWRQTLKEADSLIKAYEAFKKDPSQDNQLRYDTAMFILWDCCTEQLNYAIAEMKADLPYQQGFEKNYEWEQSSKGKRRCPRIYAKDWFLEDPLFWSLDCFCNDRFRDFHCDPVVYLQVFDQQLRKASEKERRRISPIMMRRIGELAAIDEIRTAIKCAPGINRNALIDYRKKYEGEVDKALGRCRAFIKVKNNAYEQDDILNAAFPYLEKLCAQHPWPKGQPDATTIKRTAASRDALAEMWYQIRLKSRHVVRKENVPTEYAVECLQQWSADQSDDYKTLRRDEEADIRRAFEAKDMPKRPVRLTDATVKMEQQPRAIAEPPESRNLKKTVLQDQSTNKSKTKTRREASITESAPVPDPTPEVEATLRVAVKQSSLPLLEQMFPLADLNAEAGKTWKWQHFVAVMLDAGFNVSKGSGSAVSFEHPSGLGRIVFHQPHPQPVIDPYMLRSMGRRLSRSFGWARDVFVVRQ